MRELHRERDWFLRLRGGCGLRIVDAPETRAVTQRPSRELEIPGIAVGILLDHLGKQSAPCTRFEHVPRVAMPG